MLEEDQEGMRNKVVDFFKRSDADYRDAKQPKFIAQVEGFKPKSSYDRFALWLNDSVVDTEGFETVSGLMILLSAVVTGMQVQAEDYYNENPGAAANIIDGAIVYLFCIECNVRIVAEGSHPLRYFVGESFLPELKHVMEGTAVDWGERWEASTWDVRARWNCFDFFISYVSLVFTYTDLGLGAAADLTSSFRLLRALRLLSLMQRFEELKVIMEGFQAGLNSFAYIGMLLIIVFYVYAILGLYIFGQNDPAHFGNLLAAMISLFRCATLSAWYELLYINWYGCDVYPAGAYVLAPHLASPFDDGVVVARAGSVTSSAGGADDGPASGGDQPLLLVDTGAGHFPAFVCSNPSSQPTSSMLYFFTFTLLANYVILSLLVGVVTISMQATMSDLHEANLRELRDERLRLSHRKSPMLYTRYVYGGRSGKQLVYGPDGRPTTELLKPVISKVVKAGQRVRGRGKGAKKTQAHASLQDEEEFVFGVETPVRATLAHFMRLGIRGRVEVKPTHMPGSGADGGGVYGAAAPKSVVLEVYLALARLCRRFINSWFYSFLLVFLISTYAGLVGIETYLQDDPTIYALQSTCVVLFAVECVVKLVAEGEAPLEYFKDRWNLFDLAVAVGGVVAMAGGSGPNVGLSLARLVRLVQVFKLAYRMPLLQLVIEALLYGCRSMVWVALLFGLFNYLFAIIGCLVFRDNDPFYFGGLRRSLITLWLVETLQNWEQPMMVNVFGCDVYGYGMAGDGSQQAETVYRLPAPEGCTKPHGTGAFAAVYFILVAVVGGLVLPTLLTAVITASTVHMGRNKEERSANAAKVDGVIALAPEYLHPTRVALLEELFENLDVSGDGSLAPDELQPAFTALSDEVLRHTNAEFIKKLFSMVDKSDDGMVDFSEFLGFFSRLTSAMALRLNRSPNEFVEDPVVFEQQFVALLLELARGAAGGGGGGGEGARAEAAASSESMTAKQVAAMKRSGAIGLELVDGVVAAGGHMLNGARHEPSTIFEVYDSSQLHRHIKWLAARLEAKTAEVDASKRELRRLKSALGAFDPAPPRDAAQPPPPPVPFGPDGSSAWLGRSIRSRKLIEALGSEAHGGAGREQWEMKLAAAKASGGAAAKAAARVLAVRASAQLQPTQRPGRAGGGGGGGGNGAPDDGFTLSAAVASASVDLVAEWEAVLALAAEAAEAAAEDCETARAAQSNPDQPVAPWTGTGGWARLQTHTRANATTANLPTTSLS